MAAAKSSTTRAGSGQKAAAAANKKTGRSQGTKKSSAQAGRKTKDDKERINQRKVQDVNEYKDRMAFETAITLIVMAIFAVFLYFSYSGLGGIVGKILGGLFLGIFGWCAWILPAGIITGYIFGLVNQGDRRVPRKTGSFIAALWLLLGISDLLSGQEIISEYYTSNHVMHKKYFECMDLTLGDVIKNGKGNPGLLGRFISSLFSKITGETCAVIIMTALFILCLFIFHGMEFMAALRKRNAYKQEMESTYEEISSKEGYNYKEPSYRVIPQPAVKRRQERKPGPPMQTVNLMQMNMVLDEIEENKRKEALGRSPMEEITIENPGAKTGGNTGRKAEKKKTMPEKPKETIVPPVIKTASTEIPVITREEKKEVKENQEKYVNDIPVFRDELNKKFGRKRNIVQETTQETLFPIKDIEETGFSSETNVEDGFDDIVLVHAPESNTNTRTSPVTAEPVIPEYTETPIEMPEDIQENINIPDRVTETAEKSIYTEEPEEEIIQEEIIQKEAIQEYITEDVIEEPEEETDDIEDITGDTDEILTETIKEPEPAAVPSYKRPETTTNHGRIGGDNYISASNTFNALNDSKEAALAELPEPEYVFPEPGLLHIPEKSSNGMTDDDLRNTAVKLQETLKSFNVDVKMGAVTCGPTVTRYELFPEQGVRVNKITNLADDLKLNLAAKSIRIEAPIPGKSAVGIEIPNPEPGSVGFRELIESEEFINSKSPVTFAVGKDIGGKTIITDIAKMPHLLIAGATGSGKSVCINTLIMSILYKADPKDVKIIMIDPKVVELSVYNGIPHLFCPVVTDPQEASAALNWAVREMMDRYNKFKELGVRNITGYNKKIKNVQDPEVAGYAKMPSLVIIVDEFADLMMVASKEVEDAVCRIAQLARAAGIHLVLATQRPSVNVITGLIKANIPSRIAFSVSSSIDSRTILDKNGAEKLIGKGDMLFFPSGYSEPVRVQGAFISDKEVSDVVEFLRNNNEEPDYNENVTEIVETETSAPEPKEPKSDRDEYFEEAGRFVIESKRAAAGQLQRKFSIGFNRAGRIIDQLHKAGVVGPAEGTKPRKILMTMNDFDLLTGNAGPVSESEIEETLQNYAEANGLEGVQDGQY